MKRWFALVLAVCMLIVSVPAAMADSWGVFEGSTTLIGSSANKIANIQRAVEALDGTAVFCGETFSFNEVVGPRDKERGYLIARNGRGVQVYGGGVSQLAATLYLAVRDCMDVEVGEFYYYGDTFVDGYVENGEDAVVTDYKANRDFEFTSNFEGVIYISAWMDDENVYCSVELLDELTGAYGKLIGVGTTMIYGSDNKKHNIGLTADRISGVELEHGDVFSFNEIVGPRSQQAGFYNAENGRGVKVRGGGVAQVASTIYLALKDVDCVAVDHFRTYGKDFKDGYVENPDDAVVTDYSAGYDLSFTYWGDDTLYVILYEDGDQLVCEIYED